VLADASPVIVIGAGRSGTNLLRDIICTFDGFDTWPCDEINYIWRHGNRGAPTDELTPADARPEVVRYIRQAFVKQRRRCGGDTLVEKTCANSLRVGFVYATLPEARFVYIARDGRDVVASAMHRWTASLDVKYLARKARFVPPADLPYYALKYGRSRLSRFGTTERRVSTWGPRFDGMTELVRSQSLAEVCARQWLTCVESAEQQFAEYVSPSQLFRLRYEDLVTDPSSKIRCLADFIGATGASAHRFPRVSATQVGRWRSTLSTNDQAAVSTVFGDALAARGYES
jgi:Sulfotransferase domain